MRTLDLFGHPITLKYKKRTHSTTLLGGFFSLLFVAGIALYFAVLIVRSQDNRAAKVTSVLERTNMGYETPARVLGLTDENFDIAIGFQYAGKNKSITPVTIDQYFSYTLSQIYYGLITDPNLIASYGSSYYWNKTVIPLSLCDPTRFLGMSDIAGNLGITNTMYCPDLEDYTLNLTGGFSTQTA